MPDKAWIITEKGKSKIINPNKEVSIGSSKVTFLINPGKFKVSKSTNWREIATNGLDVPQIQFTTGERKTIEAELILAASLTTEKKDVLKEYYILESLLEVVPSLHRPPVLTFTYGALSFKCVMEQLDVEFVLFNSSGNPRRAVVNVVLKEYFDQKDQHTNKTRQSNDYHKNYIIRKGEDLAGIAMRAYGDSRYWRKIAEHNNLTDPMNLPVGKSLVIPPII